MTNNLKAERTPSVTRNEEVGFTEIVTDDVPTVTAPIIAANVEVLYDMHDRNRIIGFRVYDQSLSTQQPMGEPSTSFQMLMDAYIRGYAWSLENRDSQAFVHKAAYDYADKTTSALHPNQESGE